MGSPWRRRPLARQVDEIINDAMEACEGCGAPRSLIWSRLTALMGFWEDETNLAPNGNYLLSEDLSIPIKVPPPFAVVHPPLTQLTLPFDVVGPTAERFGPEFEPDKTAAKLAAGWRSWHEGEAS